MPEPISYGSLAVLERRSPRLPVRRLPRTSAGRLRAVAGIIQERPRRWQQAVWARVPRGVDSFLRPIHIAGRGPECDSFCCVAGWTIAVTPQSLVAELAETLDTNSFQQPAGVLLGLTPAAAMRLFAEGVQKRHTPDEMAAVLRNLAKTREPRDTWDLAAAGFKAG